MAGMLLSGARCNGNSPYKRQVCVVKAPATSSKPLWSCPSVAPGDKDEASDIPEGQVTYKSSIGTQLQLRATSSPLMMQLPSFNLILNNLSSAGSAKSSLPSPLASRAGSISGPVSRISSSGSISPALRDCLERVKSWNTFDIFLAKELTKGRPLAAVTTAALKKFGLFDKYGLSKPKVATFLQEVEARYHPENPYHTNTHAADIVQTMSSVLASMGSSLTEADRLAALIAAAVHDVGHPGVSNDFLIATHSQEAAKYQGVSVNEQGHLDLFASLLKSPEIDFLEPLTPTTRSMVDMSIHSMVMGTDMKAHRELLQKVNEAADAQGGEVTAWTSPEARGLLMAFMLHCADISNAAKTQPMAAMWAKLVTQEFWSQGDRERQLGLPISPMCDRSTADMPNDQIKFIQYVVEPTFQALARIAPAVGAKALDNCRANKAYYQQLVAEGVKQLS